MPLTEYDDDSGEDALRDAIPRGNQDNIQPRIFTLLRPALDPPTVMDCQRHLVTRVTHN